MSTRRSEVSPLWRKSRLVMLIISGILFIAFIATLNYGGCGGGGGKNNSGSSGETFIIVTNSATNIARTSATLNGIVNPNGTSTEAYFQYGKTTTYGSNTSHQNMGSGTNNVNVYANIAGLTVNTTYNFRLVAIRGDKTYNGVNQTFTTSGLPTCTTNPANNITLYSATLNGRVNPNGFDTDVYFDYDLTTSYALSTTPQAIGNGTLSVAVTAALNSLSPDTLYNFRVVGNNPYGTTYGNNLIFITGSFPGSPPTCTTDPASNVISNSATLNGTVNPNGTSTDAYFNYGLTTSYTLSTTAQAINGTTSVAVTAALSNLSPGTPYNFRVVGNNSYGTTYGNNLTFTTAPPPPTCTTNAADNITYNSAQLNGTVNPNGIPTIAYFSYGLTASYTVTTTSRTSGNWTGNVAVSAAVSSLNSNTLYNFRCVANNSSGTTYGNNLTFTTAPPPPTCTTNPADNITYNSARLNGTVNPNAFTTTTYFNYGLTTSYAFTTTPQAIGSGINNVPVYADISGLSSNTVYNFRCIAFSIGGTRQGTNRTFGHWSQTTFPPASGASGEFINTQSANSNNDVILGLDWLQRYSTTVTPSARYSHAMAYDSLRQKTVLFGGGWTTTYNNETWEWDGTNWLQCYSTTVTPTARRYSAMAYDSLRQKTVLFGGNTGTVNNETWEWDGTNWLQRYSTTVTPSARYGHAIAYDSLSQKTVLFGGNTGGNETWEWDGTNWLQHYSTTVTPSARYYHAMAYDSIRNVTVLFGGNTGAVNNETWEWNGTNWTLRTTTGPAARYVHAMAYDSVRQLTVLFGGTTSVANDETWEWDGTNWLQRSPDTIPSPRYYHAMAYDSIRNVTILFGGSSGGNETWESGSLYVSSGTYVSESITPASISSWGILTFTYNAPANTTFTVDILKSTDDSLLAIDVPSGTDLSIYPALNGVTGIKLLANFATTNNSVTSTLFDWGVGYSD